ncbi:MAG: hypothetical protein AAF479_18410, partial [Pseudomonadota bacterium]
MMQFGSGATQRLGDTARKFLQDSYEKQHGRKDMPEVSQKDCLMLIMGKPGAEIVEPHQALSQLSAYDRGSVISDVINSRGANALAVQHFTSAAQSVSGGNPAQIAAAMNAAINYDLASQAYFRPAAHVAGKMRVKMRRNRPEWRPVPAGSSPSTNEREVLTEEFPTTRYGGKMTFDEDILQAGAVQDLEDDARDFVKGHFVAFGKARKATVRNMALANQIAADVTGSSLIQRQFITLLNAVYDLQDEVSKWDNDGVQLYFEADPTQWEVPWVNIQNMASNPGQLVGSVSEQNAIGSIRSLQPIWTKRDPMVTNDGPFLIANFGNFSTVVYERDIR